MPQFYAMPRTALTWIFHADVHAPNGTISFTVSNYIMNTPQIGGRIMSDNQAYFWKNRHYSVQNA